MTYEEIIQKPGKQIEPKVYYYNEGTRVDLDRDQIILVHPSFKASLTGTVMKEMEVELKTQLPNTDIYIENTASYGTYNATKEFGRYRLNEVTYNADTKTYTHLLYDDMLNLMVDYAPIAVTYPISLYDWFSAFVEQIGYTTQIASLPNGTRILEHDIYEGIGFTNRDVLEDIGNATATLFGINNSEIIKVEFGTETKVIDDDILRNQNIKMGEHFGAINVVVLSRAGGSDNIYYPAELPENPIEYKITENQLMNDNNRSDYLPELYNALNGIEYDIFDCQLVGFGGFYPLDKVQIRTFENATEKVYNSYVFNNDIKITQGYDESIYTPMPEETTTNYKASDTTDRRINQAYMIVDKQKQEIEALISKNTELTSEVERLKITIEGLENQVQVTGGINLIKDSMGVLKDGSWSNVESIKDNFTSENATGGSAIMINQTDYNENVFDESNTTLSNLTYDNGTYTQITADTNTYIGWKINAFNNNDFVKMLATKRQAELGEVTMSFTKDSSFNKIAFGLNGADRDTLILFDVSSLENKQNYELSLDFLNNVQGQISWNNVEIKKENERYRQIVKSKNGTYTISFKYYKTLEANNCKFKINEIEYGLTEVNTLTNFQETIEVTAGETTIEFSGDTDNSCYIIDLMMNEGTGVASWTQNQDETTTDTVKIGKGIEVLSSTTDTKAKIDSDGFRVQSTVTQKNVLEATATGIITEELETKGNNNLDGLLIQTINGNHHWISGV